MTQQPWWRTDEYDRDTSVPVDLFSSAGSEGPALVRAWSDGTTDAGWGESAFMNKYTKRAFNHAPIVAGHEQGRFAFAFVMRSMRLICIDIDGKNGGFEHVGKLGMLPHTLAETSKSGEGYHLFYRTSDDQWDPNLGFAEFSDRIGIEQGVDIRATGCVYHHTQQRWNNRAAAELPQHVKDRLRAKAQTAAAQTAAIKSILASEDPMEVAMMQDDLITDLKKPIQPGKRNTTLFAIGTQMCEAQVPGWQGLLEQRALDIGLDAVEATKLVANIERYGAKKP